MFNQVEQFVGMTVSVPMSECCHAVGTATVEYHLDLIHEDASGDGVHEGSFSEFSYCPYCGESVYEEASVVRERIIRMWDEFWEGYAQQHGEEEMKRARRGR